MKRDIAEFVAKCDVCRRVKVEHQRPKFVITSEPLSNSSKPKLPHPPRDPLWSLPLFFSTPTVDVTDQLLAFGDGDASLQNARGTWPA